MSLFQKLALSTLLVAVVPLVVLGFSLIDLHQRTLVELIAEREQTEAQELADRLGRSLTEQASRIAGLIRLADPQKLSNQERAGLVRAIYQSSTEIVAVGWLSAAGKPLLPVVALGPDGAPDDRAAQRLVGRGQELARLPLDPGDMVVSPVRAPAALYLVSLIDEKAGDRLVVELSLSAVVVELTRRPAQSKTMAVLVDEHGEALLAPTRAPPPVDLSAHKNGVAFVGSDDDGSPYIGVVASVGNSALSILLFQPQRDALAVVRRMRTETLGGIAVAVGLALALGWLVSAGLRRRLQRYGVVAKALGAGQLSERVADQGGDELAVLATALDDMAAGLQQSRSEIEAFNRELQARVETRTAELKSAQARLAQAAKLTAIGQLGAGVAHEIGNPLARILGHVQLLQLDEAVPGAVKERVAKIELAAKRVEEVTQALLRFSQTANVPSEPGLSLYACAKEGVAIVRSRFEALQVGLDCVGEESVRVEGKRAQLVQAIFQLLENARVATPAGGRVTVTVGRSRERAMVTVKDTGKGIAKEHLDQLFDPFFTTKSEWDSPGLGLSLVYRIMQEHQGEVVVESEVGRGTTAELRFPAT